MLSYLDPGAGAMHPPGTGRGASRVSPSRESSTGAISSEHCGLADTIPQPTTLRPDAGSFRDWDGRVYVGDRRVLRALSAQGLYDREDGANEVEVFAISTSGSEFTLVRP